MECIVQILCHSKKHKTLSNKSVYLWLVANYTNQHCSEAKLVQHVSNSLNSANATAARIEHHHRGSEIGHQTPLAAADPRFAETWLLQTYKKAGWLGLFCGRTIAKNSSEHLSVPTCFADESILANPGNTYRIFFYCCNVFGSPLLSFLRLLAQIIPTGGLATFHFTASPQSEFCAAGVHLFYSRTITITCRVI